MSVQTKFATVRNELNSVMIERGEEIDFTLTALVAQEHALLVGPPGCQPAGSKVMMADGKFKPIEEVKEGDVVLSPQHDGSVIQSRVLRLATHLDQPVYRITMNGKSKKSYLCSGNHIIPYVMLARESRKSAKARGVPISQRRRYGVIAHTLAEDAAVNPNGKSRIFTTPAYELEEKIYDVHPYVLGVLLGDGCITGTMNNPTITTVDRAIIERVKKYGCEIGCAVSKKGTEAKSFNVIGQSVKKIAKLCVFGRDSHGKFIPEEYLHGSVEQRLQLLAGLIDTDGSRDSFSTVSKLLAIGFQHLIHSVGGFARISERYTSCKGKKFKSYRVSYSTAELNIPLTLAHKKQRNRDMLWKNPRNRSFTSELVGRDTVYGFALDSPSRWYITNDFLVTHNTGKSMLLDAITEWCDGKRFSILVNKFTSPEEMFGPVSLTGLKEDRYQRITDGKLPEADFAFVDEVFKGSSAILNSMLKILNERTFDNGSAGLQKVPLKLCLGASNEWPGEGDQGKELNALFDRFLLRKSVKPIAGTDGRRKLLWGGDHKAKLSGKLLPAELQQANSEANALPWSAEAKTAFETVLQELSSEGIRPGDRRQYKAVRIAQAYAWLQGATEVEPDHLEILSHVLWDDPIEQPLKCSQVISKVSNPLHFVINGFLVEAHNVKAELKNPKDLAGASAAIAKLDEIHTKLKSIKSDNQKMKDARKEISRMIRDIKIAVMPPSKNAEEDE